MFRCYSYTVIRKRIDLCLLKLQMLEEISKGENIVKWIKEQRISWLGHLERMEEDRMPKKIFTQEMEGTRRRGRPRKRWKEEVERDLQVVEVRRWRELVADRKKMEEHCSTGQGPQWAVVPMEEEEEEKKEEEESYSC